MPAPTVGGRLHRTDRSISAAGPTAVRCAVSGPEHLVEVWAAPHSEWWRVVAWTNAAGRTAYSPAQDAQYAENAENAENAVRTLEAEQHHAP